MTIKQLNETLADFPPDMKLRVEFGINHHVPLERVDEHHPEGSNENYLLIILE